MPFPIWVSAAVRVFKPICERQACLQKGLLRQKLSSTAIRTHDCAIRSYCSSSSLIGHPKPGSQRIIDRHTACIVGERATFPRTGVQHLGDHHGHNCCHRRNHKIGGVGNYGERTDSGPIRKWNSIGLRVFLFVCMSRCPHWRASRRFFCCYICSWWFTFSSPYSVVVTSFPWTMYSALFPIAPTIKLSLIIQLRLLSVLQIDVIYDLHKYFDSVFSMWT